VNGAQPDVTSAPYESNEKIDGYAAAAAAADTKHAAALATTTTTAGPEHINKTTLITVDCA